ncbi:MAG: epoxyqueuosine reductase QueH [Clostridia bacterium]|nr:epoxyqueuosine reductase QueH [Clostridia bacterium]
MKENYDKKMQDICNNIPKKQKRLLLHSCCAPCSSACLERLKDFFKITVFYYNPNIDDQAEYEKRKAEQIRFLQEMGWADFLDCDHDEKAFETIALGLEEEPERGKRCYLCYGLRLEKTAQTAKEKGFDFFATTLSVSPYKNAEWLNALGEEYANKTGVNFLPSDFKKQGGYYRSQELSSAYGLYRQDYCGCRFSKAERERKTKCRE